MSLIQTQVYARSIVVVADTLTEWRAVEPGSARLGTTSTSKLATIPHMPAILAARGHTCLPQALGATMLLTPDFDRFMAGFPETFEQITAKLAPSVPSAVFEAEAELVLAGWSPAAGRLMAWHAAKPAGGSFTVSEIQGDAYAPPPFADGTRPPTPGSPETHAAVARLQVERIRTESDGVAGGDLTIATLTRDGIKVEVVRGFA